MGYFLTPKHMSGIFSEVFFLNSFTMPSCVSVFTIVETSHANFPVLFEVFQSSNNPGTNLLHPSIKKVQISPICIASPSCAGLPRSWDINWQAHYINTIMKVEIFTEIFFFFCPAIWSYCEQNYTVQIDTGISISCETFNQHVLF